MDPLSIILVICSAILSGFGTAIVNSFKDSKKERIRQSERAQDALKLDMKDLKIDLYELERELNTWKDKYYKAMQELIEIKAELESALIQLNILEIEDIDLENYK
jgi:septal ring factor EnvC (AmiA/AmiB activator)